MRVSVFVLVGLALLCSTLISEGRYGVMGEPVDADVRGVPQASATDDDVARRESVSIHYTEEEEERMKAAATRHVFDAEVGKLMNIIINSLYSNKEIFVRELISNASDALDKIRLASLTDASALDSGNRLEIRISYDATDKTITFRDTGVGMTHDELLENLGTIARSGTEKFVKHAAESGATGNTESLIGQFGVGFYSAFLVADRVTVTSKSNDDDKQWIWESSASSDFTITEDPRGATLGRGTRIVLHLKQDGGEAEEYQRQERLKEIIERYSEFIGYPIFLRMSSTEETFEEPEEGAEAGEAAEPTKVTRTVWRWELVNDPRVPIWRRAKAENSREDYVKFYETLTRDEEPPMAYDHFKAEGDVEFSAIVYVPEDPSADRGEGMHRGPRLYVRRVFITDNWQFLIPRYLDFLKGVVDSDDLPLNVSREMLQQHKTLEAIKKKLVRKAIQLFQRMADDAETSEEARAKFERFMARYGNNLKVGVIEDMLNRSRLARLVRFHTSKSGDKQVPLETVVSRMRDGQKSLFYLAGDDLAQLRNSPLIEAFRSRGVEVIFAPNAIDEYMFLNLGKFEHKHQLVNVGVESFDMDAALKDIDPMADDPDNDDDDDFKKTTQKESLSEEDTEMVMQHFQDALGSKISRAKESKLLTSSPCALISGMFGMSANMRKVIRAQAAARGKDGADIMPEVDTETKVLEVNIRHPLIHRVHELLASNPDSPELVTLTNLLYDTASIASGFGLDDEKSFVQTLHNILQNGISNSVPTNHLHDEL